MHNNTDHINFIFSLNVGFRIRWFSIVGNINKPFLAFITFVQGLKLALSLQMLTKQKRLCLKP